MRGFIYAGVVLTVAATAWGFNPPQDTAGPLTVKIEGPSKITATESAQSFHVTLENAGDSALQGNLRIQVIDQWRVEPAAPVAFTLAPKATSQSDFSVTAGKGTYNALYPVHAFVDFDNAGQKLAAHAVLIVQTELPDVPRPKIAMDWRPFKVEPDRTLPLLRLPLYRPVIQVIGEPPVVLEPCWQGTEPRTYANIMPGVMSYHPDARESLGIHPPWRDGHAGTAWVEFPLQLPEKQPIQLKFATAIRDTTPPEPPSDGVTFRVRVVSADAPDGELGQIVFEKHSDAKTWQEAEADLSPFAGQSIRLQLESHPGPKNDTTCDQSFWGNPILTTGKGKEAAPVAKEGTAAPRVALGTIKQNDCSRAVLVQLGKRGLLDSTCSFKGPEDTLEIGGFHVRLKGDNLEESSSIAEFLGMNEEQSEKDSFLRVRHQFRAPWGTFDVMVEVAVEKEGALNAKCWLENAPEPASWNAVYIEDVSAGPWSKTARRIYAGVGNVVSDPKGFELGFDGHQLSTSFVGFDFPDISIVQAVDVPPNKLEVSPEKKIYTLHAPLAQTIRIIPCKNVWDGVKEWRKLDGRKAAGGVAKLAGRFVFDLWGGNYASSAKALDEAFRYGLTDSIVVWHNWQRWGFDYRLPDIFPPNPDLGTLDEFQALARTCKDHGVLFAPHDNYIDFYPDATGFSYDRVAFDKSGQPIRAWLNEGRKAQAFRWRTDALRPFLEANVKTIKEQIAPTAYFIDVWSSIGPYESWTHDGQLQDRVLTRNTWGEAFAWIRDYLGDNAPQISESGHDQLIGYLDGAQCNHLRVGKPLKGGQATTWNIECGDAERVPWIDAAYHDRFALHGAGYESRFLAGLDRETHGCYSDDYYSVEVLTGHPAMVPEAFSANVVRTYWLLHDLARALAGQSIESVEFAEGDIHRQHVQWSNGDTWINRGTNDWAVDGRRLPDTGFLARAGGVEASIERMDATDGSSMIIERSQSPSATYVSTRAPIEARMPVAVNVDSIALTENRGLSLRFRWEIMKPLGEQYTAFVHFVDENGKILFQADHPLVEPAAGQTVVYTQSHATIPETIKPGGSVEMRVGLYRPGASRLLIHGVMDGERRIRLGKLTLAGTGDAVEDVLFQPIGPIQEQDTRLNIDGKSASIGGIVTNGACRMTRDDHGLLITPLPQHAAFDLQMPVAAMPFGLPAPRKVEALAADGSITQTTAASVENGVVKLSCAPGIFAYRLTQ